jgi:hypothetical protein
LSSPSFSLGFFHMTLIFRSLSVISHNYHRA